MEKLSAVIITFNEEKNIERCIRSVLDISDEVIVVDSGSTDKTISIAESLGAKVIQNNFIGHIEQKNFALDQASNNWVISLDADEALSDKLRNSIKSTLSDSPAVGYSMNRLNNYCGTWIRHGAWYPDVKLRMFDKTKVRWGGVNPHDKAIPLKGEKTKHIKGDLLHYSYYSILEHSSKLDYFSTIAAKAYLKDGKKAGFWNLRIRPPFAFFRDYVLRLGFLDGYHGWVIARFSAYYTFLKYVKLRNLRKTNS
ncbi:MAG: glycosyltransferase family 2 protein [Bacteroidia bacterium]